MINFNFAIKLPSCNWRTLWIKIGKTPFPNKYWEFALYRSSDIISLEVSLTTKTDHAGLTFGCGIFGYTVQFIIYDDRHWDDQNNRWDD